MVCWGRVEDKNRNIVGLYTQLTGAMDFVCGVMTDANINCWGYGHIPTAPEPGQFHFVQVSCAVTHCSGLDINGHVLTWGHAGLDVPDFMRAPMVALDPAGL